MSIHIESFKYFLRWVSYEYKSDRDLLKEYNGLVSCAPVIQNKETLYMKLPLLGGLYVPYPTHDGTLVLGGNKYSFNSTCVFYSRLPLMFNQRNIVMYLSSSLRLLADRNAKNIITIKVLKCTASVDDITKDMKHSTVDLVHKINIMSALACLLQTTVKDVKHEIIKRLNRTNDIRRAYISYLCAVATDNVDVSVQLHEYIGQDAVYHLLSILMKYLDDKVDRDSDLSIRRVISYGDFLVEQCKLLQRLKNEEEERKKEKDQAKKRVIIPQSMLDDNIRRNINMCTKLNDIDKIKFPKYDKTLDYSSFGIICPIDKSGKCRVLSEHATVLLPLDNEVNMCREHIRSILEKYTMDGNVMVFFNGYYMANVSYGVSSKDMIASNIVTLQTASNRIDVFLIPGVPRRRIYCTKTKKEINVTIPYFLGSKVSLDSDEGDLRENVTYMCSKHVNKYIPGILHQPAIRSSYLVKQMMQMAGVLDDFKYKEQSRKMEDRFTVALLPTKDTQEDSIVMNTAVVAKMTTVSFKTYKTDNFSHWLDENKLNIGMKLKYGSVLFVTQDNRHITLRERKAEVIEINQSGHNVTVVVSYDTIPSHGDKIASLESSQKHTIVCRNQRDMPYYVDEKTNQRIYPDFIFNPNGLITRKTTVPFLRNLQYVDIQHPKYEGSVRTAVASVAYNSLYHFAISRMKTITHLNEPYLITSNNGRGARLGYQEFTVLRMIGIPELTNFFAFEKTDQYHGCFCNNCHLWSKCTVDDMVCQACGSGEIVHKSNIPVYFIHLMNLFYATNFVIETKL